MATDTSKATTHDRSDWQFAFVRTKWDVGGEDKNCPPWNQSHHGTNVLIYVVYFNDRNKIEDAQAAGQSTTYRFSFTSTLESGSLCRNLTIERAVMDDPLLVLPRSHKQQSRNSSTSSFVVVVHAGFRSVLGAAI